LKKLYYICTHKNGPVAQLDSASDYESEGYRFESCQGHNFKKQHAHYEFVAFFSFR
jgi:hypothetical protein